MTTSHRCGQGLLGLVPAHARLKGYCPTRARPAVPKPTQHSPRCARCCFASVAGGAMDPALLRALLSALHAGVLHPSAAQRCTQVRGGGAEAVLRAFARARVLVGKDSTVLAGGCRHDPPAQGIKKGAMSLVARGQATVSRRRDARLASKQACTAQWPQRFLSQRLFDVCFHSAQWPQRFPSQHLFEVHIKCLMSSICLMSTSTAIS